ncbi:TPA: hypothetical protein ACU1Q3_000677 [Salmonella enterica]
MPTIDAINNEAIKIRKLIENCDKDNIYLAIDDFPVKNCKLTSILLSYHFLTLWPELEIKGVSAVIGKNSQITHYWLEINSIVVDITGDQYNIIDDKELNNRIIKNRPYPAVHVSHIKESYLYKIFNIINKDSFVYGLPSIGDDSLEEMKCGYSQLLNKR